MSKEQAKSFVEQTMDMYMLRKYEPLALDNLLVEVVQAIIIQKDYCNGLRAKSKKKVSALQHLESLNRLHVNIQEAIEHNKQKSLMRNIVKKFEQAEEKNNCLRVRFYDWLATKFESYAKSLRKRAFEITTPCAIKLPPPKDEITWMPYIKKWEILK